MTKITTSWLSVGSPSVTFTHLYWLIVNHAHCHHTHTDKLSETHAPREYDNTVF